VVGELQGVGLPAARGGRLPTSVEAGDLSGSPSSHPPDPASEGGRTGPARRTRDPAASCLCNPDRRAGMRGLMQWKRTSKSSILFLCFDFLSHCKSLGAVDFRSSSFFYQLQLLFKLFVQDFRIFTLQITGYMLIKNSSR
jgi:hypothetical protein